jgi:flagellar biogenesis protein FliO
MAGVTLALAVCGAIAAAARHLLPRAMTGAVQVIGRVSLSPKHTVYLLRVGPRVLLVGTGPQGAPVLITELDEIPEVEQTPGRGADE